MNYSLSISNTYDNLELGLAQSGDLISKKTIDKREASRDVILQIEELLANQKIALKNIDYIAVNQGPGPFTTLRVVIATANGISFASRIAMVGVNGFDALLEYAHHNITTIALLNAFAGDLYYGIKGSQSKEIESGYQKGDQLLFDLKEKTKGQVQFLGNGATLFADKIKDLFGERASILPEPSCPTLEQITTQSYKLWNEKKSISYQLHPIYLKRAIPAPPSPAKTAQH